MAASNLGVTRLHWPGENFASGFDWKDGMELNHPDLKATHALVVDQARLPDNYSRARIDQTAAHSHHSKPGSGRHGIAR